MSLRRQLESIRDHTVHAWGHGWRLKAVWAQQTVAETLRRHQLDESESEGLSEAILASLVGTDSKGEERAVVIGPRVYAEAIPALGEVRAFVGHQTGHEGQIRLGRIQEGAREPAWSIVAGGVPELLRAQGAAQVLLWPGGGAYDIILRMFLLLEL